MEKLKEKHGTFNPLKVYCPVLRSFSTHAFCDLCICVETLHNKFMYLSMYMYFDVARQVGKFVNKKRTLWKITESVRSNKGQFNPLIVKNE